MTKSFITLLCLTASVFVLPLGGAEKIAVCAGLAPVAHLAEIVGGELVQVGSMLPEGRSPHDYAPGPRELRQALSAKVFFTTGMPHEQRIARALAGKVPVADVSRGIKRIALTVGRQHHAHKHGHDHDDCCGDGETGDPHVWLSPRNCALMAAAIARELGRIAPAHKDLFLRRAADFEARMRKLHGTLEKRLAPFKGKSFFVYHPAFGYFARLYGLHQHAIELGGREVTPARLAAVVKEARHMGVKVIFVQKQFNPASARALASAVGGRVMELDPLAPDVEKNLTGICDALVEGFGHQR